MCSVVIRHVFSSVDILVSCCEIWVYQKKKIGGDDEEHKAEGKKHNENLLKDKTVKSYWLGEFFVAIFGGFEGAETWNATYDNSSSFFFAIIIFKVSVCLLVIKLGIFFW